MTLLVETVVLGIVAGVFNGLLGSGFGLIFGVTGRFHFAYGTSLILAGYVAHAVIDAHAALALAWASGIAAGAVSGVIMEFLVYAPLVEAAPQLALLGVFVSSLGIVIMAENVIALIWGSLDISLSPGFINKSVTLGAGLSVSRLAIVSTVVCLVLVVGLWSFLRRSAFGRTVRAVQVNPDMAVAVGINPRTVSVFVWTVGSAFASVGGLLFAMNSAISVGTDLTLTFTALVVVFLAGTQSSPLRFLVAGVIVGVIQDLASVYINTLWSSVVVFGSLFVYVALTPYKPALRRWTQTLIGPVLSAKTET